MGDKNVLKVLGMADDVDTREGKEAYKNYNALLRRIADYYGFGFVQTVAAFASLSPNNDYMGTLRSVITLFKGIKSGLPVEDINTSAYRHCLERAYLFATGERDFLMDTKGMKIYNFYCNILSPEDRRFVTVDGHMHNAWAGEVRVLRHAMLSRSRYVEVADSIKRVSRKTGLLPNQVQAIVWFTWKRVHKIKYDSQLSMFGSGDDYWGLKIDPRDILPFRERQSAATVPKDNSFRRPAKHETFDICL